MAKPSVKKLGVLPGAWNRSRLIWKCCEPMEMKISDSNSCEISFGTAKSQ